MNLFRTEGFLEASLQNRTKFGLECHHFLTDLIECLLDDFKDETCDLDVIKTLRKFKKKFTIVKSKEMIVKVIVLSNECVIYNQNRSTRWQGKVSPQIIKRMKKRPKAYFNAHIENGLIVLGKEAEEQRW